MAKFVTDDGKGGISGDALMRQLGYDDSTYSDFGYTCNRKRHTDVDKMKIPQGVHNRDRLLNTNMYDLLAHMQQTLSLTGRCVLELITNEDHRCINMNDTIQHRINVFAKDRITDTFRELYPRRKKRVKVIGSDDEYELQDETDEEWMDRLCHMYMHKNHPNKLQMIKCEECLQRWMNDDKW